MSDLIDAAIGYQSKMDGAYHSGYSAYLCGEDTDDNPYPSNSPLHKEWRDGFEAAFSDCKSEPVSAPIFDDME